MNKLKKYALSSLYDMASGISSTKEQAGHGSPFVSFSTVFNNYFLPDELPDLMETSKKEQEVYSIKKGDILITRTSETIDELAMSCVATKDYPCATYSGFTKRLRPKTEGIAYYKYMAFYLRSAWFRKAVTNNAFMTLRASFNEDIFSFLNVYLPDYDVQVHIGDFLYSIEQKIGVSKRICAELESVAKTIYDYWFTQFDFPDADGKPYRSSGGEMEWNELLKRKIPRGWGVTTIGEVTRNYDSKRIPLSQNERDSMKGDIPYYGATGIMDYVNRHIFDGHYVLIAEDGSVMDEKGNPIVQMIWGKTWVNNHAHVLEGCNGYSNELLYLLLHRIPVVKIMTGSIQKKINQDNLNSYRIPHIPSFIARAFSETVAPMFEEIRVLQQENDELTKLRDWLLPMLMNGQATVADAEKETSNVIPFVPQTVEVRQAARNFGDKKTNDTADLVKAFMRRKQHDTKA